METDEERGGGTDTRQGEEEEERGGERNIQKRLKTRWKSLYANMQIIYSYLLVIRSL